jgi:hypothetical protein
MKFNSDFLQPDAQAMCIPKPSFGIKKTSVNEKQFKISDRSSSVSLLSVSKNKRKWKTIQICRRATAWFHIVVWTEFVCLKKTRINSASKKNKRKCKITPIFRRATALSASEPLYLYSTVSLVIATRDLNGAKTRSVETLLWPKKQP